MTDVCWLGQNTRAIKYMSRRQNSKHSELLSVRYMELQRGDQQKSIIVLYRPFASSKLPIFKQYP